MAFDDDKRFDSSRRDRSFGDRTRDRKFDNDRGGFKSYDRPKREFDDQDRNEIVFSEKMKAGKKRTYFFDVRKTKSEDFFLTITESTRRADDSFTRHKIFLYKEDFNRFVESLTKSVEHVKKDLLPDYNYDEFADRYTEEGEERYERELQAKRAAESSAPKAKVEEDDEFGGDINLGDDDDDDMKL